MCEVGVIIDVSPDTGCMAARNIGYCGKCIECPFSHCIEESGDRKKSLPLRDNLIKEKFYAGVNLPLLASEYHITPRQIYRIVGR